MKRWLWPGLLTGSFATVYVYALTLFAPPFFEFFFADYAPGQALRAALFWIGLHLVVPLSGALSGVAVVMAARRIFRRFSEPR